MDFDTIGPDAPRYSLVPVLGGPCAIVDPDLAPELIKSQWVAVRNRKCFYAHRVNPKTGKATKATMHRIVAQARPGQVVHHLNRNSLDNRRSNLQAMSRQAHRDLHRNEHVLIRYA